MWIYFSFDSTYLPTEPTNEAARPPLGFPKIDGFSVATEIRKVDKVIPILFLTSKSQTQDVVTGFKIGCNDYIRKPFSMEELIVRIIALSERKLQIDKKTNFPEKPSDLERIYVFF